MSETNRDHLTGQYAYSGDWDRMCRCGHTLGIHGGGGFDCLNGDTGAGGTGEPCGCEKFRPAKRPA